MQILRRYLFREVFNYFLLFIAIFLVVLLIAEIYDILGDTLKKKTELLDVVMYLVYSVPRMIVETLPMMALMSTIFSYGLLAKNREVLAMVASGISFRRLAVPAVLFGLGMTGFMFWFNESVVPASELRARYTMDVEIKQKKAVFTKRRDVLVKGAGNRFYYMENYDSEAKEMRFPILLDMTDDGSGIRQRIEAERAVLIADDKDKAGGSFWEFTNGERWLFNDDGTIQSHTPLNKPFRLKMEDNLDLFLSKAKKPAEMNYLELRSHVELMRQKGEDVAPYRTSLQQKLAYPLSCLLMALLGFAVVADVHARRFARGVSLALTIAIGFVLANNFAVKMGEDGALPAVAAGWLPVGVFAIIVAVLMSRLKRIRG